MGIVQELEEKLNAEDYRGAILLLQDGEHESAIQLASMELVSRLAGELTAENRRSRGARYDAAERLLKTVATRCNPHEVLFELLEKLELSDDDEVFTSLLKALQVVLLRLEKNRTRSLEWSLNSVIGYLDKVQLPEMMMSQNVGPEEELLLENDPTVCRLLQLNMTLLLFLEPLVAQFRLVPHAPPFRCNGLTRENVTICFIIQLMGKCLPYLNLQQPLAQELESVPKSYSVQVAEDFLRTVMAFFGNPLYLLPYGERRMRWPSHSKRLSEGVYEMSQDFFINDEKTPLLALAVLHYLLLGENMPHGGRPFPSVYQPTYIVEMGLYYAVTLLASEQALLHHKGIRMARGILSQLNGQLLTADDLEVNIYRDFFQHLSTVIVYSSVERNRKQGTVLLRDYLYRFDPSGRYMAIVGLLRTVAHNGLNSYIMSIYKDMLSEELHRNVAPAPVSPWYSGKCLKRVLTGNICHLRLGVGSDLIDNFDTIAAGLNMLRFLLICERTTNRTGVWDYVKELDERFIQPLRKAIDLSRAHYANERKKVASGEAHIDPAESETVKMSISILNGADPLTLTEEKKLELLQTALNKFDLLHCSLARVAECIEGRASAVL